MKNAANIDSKCELVRSVSDNQHDILGWIKKLHCPDGFDVDMTHGKGGFWKKQPPPPYCYDIDPQTEITLPGDSMGLPHEPESFQSLVFDPPFLTYVKNGRKHSGGNSIMSATFGGYWRYDELEDHYIHTLSEAYRLLKMKGILVFKCQDIIHNHKMHCTHANVILWAETEGFRLKDLFILAAKHRMPSPQKGQQRHARIFHSYFLVFEKCI